MVLISRVLFPGLVDLHALPDHNASNLKVSFLTIYAPTSESSFSDLVNSLKTSIGQVLGQIKDFSFSNVLEIMNFPDTQSLLIEGIK